jgi:hypothetical protein
VIYIIFLFKNGLYFYKYFFHQPFETPEQKLHAGVQGKNNVYHIKEKMRKTNFKLFGKSFLIVDCIGAFIYIIIAQNIRQ